MYCFESGEYGLRESVFWQYIDEDSVISATMKFTVVQLEKIGDS